MAKIVRDGKLPPITYFEYTISILYIDLQKMVFGYFNELESKDGNNRHTQLKNHLIGLIKTLRDNTPISLRDAKEIIEAFIEQEGSIINCLSDIHRTDYDGFCFI